MKVYEYNDDSYYSSNGCDCCEPDYMECYNLINVDGYNYSCHTIDDCYRQCLELKGIIDEELGFDYSEVDFQLMCQVYGIKVIVHTDEEFDEGEF